MPPYLYLKEKLAPQLNHGDKMVFCPCLCQLTETGTNRVKR
ncbi:hypothetical protein VL20_1687 [Microcystis panniformis FACHB-1757]|uniref:Uncharacterized protein n=1 Tax=Microcystis panniformis FACHB-1757 TaxID=1638788 RepID=A0A0K1RY71_9CHRO|nr:hypothetical protein VL20_1687 [Microcystis panniformis FACHB-1757]